MKPINPLEVVVLLAYGGAAAFCGGAVLYLVLLLAWGFTL